VSARPRILIAEQIADAGVALLRERFDVDVGVGWGPEELAQRLSAYDGILIRSGTQLTADLIAAAARLRVIARAGIGVDNVDVAAATKRGVVVANAPESNIIAATEHTMALILALARHIPQAHRSLTEGRWERGRFAGTELYEKTLGVLGFGRIGQLVAARAKAFGMHVLAFDAFVSAERYRELGVEQAESSSEVYRRSDFITMHLPRTAETRGWLDAEAFAQMRDGVFVINCARGELVVEEALQEALDSGRVGGAALDVFPREPVTDHPLFGYDNVVVTPHLGASTAEAQDRAGIQAAEQVVAALTGGVVTNAVNIPTIPAEDMEVLGPFLPLCEQLGRLGMALADGSSVDRIELEFLGRVADRDTRLLSIAALRGVLRGHTEEDVNLVNAPAIAEERGIDLVEIKRTTARDFTDLVRVTVVAGESGVRVVGTTLGRRHRPHLLEAWGQRFNVQIEPYVSLFRYSDVPGMLGRVGTAFGARGINIVSAAVGRQPDAATEGDARLAAMVVTTDAPVPPAVIEDIVATDGFVDGRTVAL
jgi:D-3-phosphoglycerate dehydrogenase / 2-oxoglutarate reductase